MNPTAEGTVRAETHHGITTIEFHHPQSNALPRALLEALAQQIMVSGKDDLTKVIILRSAGDKTFCAGAAFNELAAIKNEEEGAAFFSGFARVVNAMRKCPKMIIGRIHGKCVGGGVGIAAACDYAIAYEAADVKLSELTIGIGPFVVGPAVIRKIGLSAFSQLAIDAAMWRNADWARRKGLYAELHPTIEGMDESIARLAAQLQHSSVDAMHSLKKILWQDAEHWDTLLTERAAISGRLVAASEAQQAIQAKVA